MLNLSSAEIHLAAAANNKVEAITAIASALMKSGCVQAGYLQGMLQREEQTSTYLGNGIAIPHGTIDTRNQVQKTGVQIFQFPQGIDWGAGEKAYVVIGIAARSTEHLTLLQQLTRILADESATQRLATTGSVDEFIHLLSGQNSSTPWQLTDTLMDLAVESDNLMSLQFINAQRLQRAGIVTTAFIADVIKQPALNLGEGIWLSDSGDGCLTNGVAISRPARAFQQEGAEVRMLITMAMIDQQPTLLLQRLAYHLSSGQASVLLDGDEAHLLATLTAVDNAAVCTSSSLKIEVVIHNEHGLHTRPGAVLVNVAKHFKSDVNIINLDGDGRVANARSLIKLVTLGAKKGHRLQITANGEDAEQALRAIEDAIAQGLGE